VYFYEASTISAISAEDITGNSLANEQFPADSYLYGTITSITLSGGAAIAYRL
jgi:hypothetical protein